MEQEDKEEVIRLVLEHSHKYPSKWAAITIVAGRLGKLCAQLCAKWVLE